MKDKVTVVTVSYNADKVIEPTIKSVVNQTYPNLEYVIIDGSSTDNTLNIIKKYSNKISAWYSEPDRGIYDGMNKGLDVATGDWIIFMNAGDRFLHKNVLKDFFEEKEWGDNTAVIYGNSYKTNGILAKKEVVNSPFWKNKSYLHGSGICHQASFVKRSVAIQYPFNLKFKHAADMKMFNDIYYAGYKFEYLQETVCLFDITDSFGKRNPWSGIRDQAMILNRYGTVSYYIYCLKELFIIKPKDWFASHIKSWIKYLNYNAYLKFQRKHGSQLTEEVTEDDWGLVDQQ